MGNARGRETGSLLKAKYSIYFGLQKSEKGD